MTQIVDDYCALSTLGRLPEEGLCSHPGSPTAIVPQRQAVSPVHHHGKRYHYPWDGAHLVDDIDRTVHHSPLSPEEKYREMKAVLMAPGGEVEGPAADMLFSIWVQPMVGDSTEIVVAASNTIIKLKQTIEQVLGVATIRQQLNYKGSTLREYVAMSGTEYHGRESGRTGHNLAESFTTMDVVEGSPTKQAHAYVSTDGAPGNRGTQDQLDAYSVLDEAERSEVPHTLQHYGIRKHAVIHLVTKSLGEDSFEPPRPAKMNKLFVKTIKPVAITVEVPYTHTMRCREIKEFLQASHDIAVDQQRLRYAGRDLVDSATIEGSGLQPDAVLHLIYRELNEDGL